MKKLIIPIALLLMWAGNTKAADFNSTVTRPQVNQQSTVASAPATNMTVAMLLEENIRLREETEALYKQVDDLGNNLDYTRMMHTSLFTLQKVLEQEQSEDVQSKLDYARMMHVTLMNLTALANAN